MEFILTPEDKYAYLSSLSNLYALKVFHDEGVDVSKFSDFMVYPNSFASNGLDILFEGLKGLFQEVKAFSPYDGDEENEYLDSLVRQKVLEFKPEYAYVIIDERVSVLLNSSFKDEVLKFLEIDIAGEVFCGEIAVLPKGFIIAVDFEGDIHEAVEEIVSVHRSLNKYMKELSKDGFYSKAV